MRWLHEYAAEARRTDKFNERGAGDYAALLAAGLIGEAGSVLAEFKKEKRERDAYPAYRKKMLEEFGDFLWYFVRLVDLVAPDLLDALPPQPTIFAGDAPFLTLGAAVGEVLGAIDAGDATASASHLQRIWNIATHVASAADVDLQAAARENVKKIRSRWPESRDYYPLFDEGCDEEEQLPRRLTIDFREHRGSHRSVVFLRCNGINFGDRLTDNIEGHDDGYRFHDVFHFAYAVHLGWSPVVRALLKAKRKSQESKDEGQDGARATIVEEAVSAIVFSRAKHMNLFEVDSVDYDLLKTIEEFVRDFEVSKVPLWQWEVAILEGFATFRKLKLNRGGSVLLNLERRRLEYRAPTW